MAGVEQSEERASEPPVGAENLREGQFTRWRFVIGLDGLGRPSYMAYFFTFFFTVFFLTDFFFSGRFTWAAGAATAEKPIIMGRRPKRLI